MSRKVGKAHTFIIKNTMEKETLADKKFRTRLKEHEKDKGAIQDVYWEEDVRGAVERLKKRFEEFDMVFKLNLVNDMIDEEFGEL